ncbi:flagellin lysine-N-methylase [Massilia putida]|uniref:flagellin lysine-N-methylase n=1 Tax=Massilia putida TaxID=1141883 RepID=UPI000952D777|nr:flagellin lysine-N-methylase [Massilia putida]
MSILHPTKTLPALLPRYVTRFACIGSACEDNCCSGWLVTLDKKTFHAYRNSTHPELKPIFAKHVKRSRATDNDELHYGKITLDPASQSCPAMSCGLCAVQKNLDESHLSNTCFTYPRQTRRFRGQHEQALNLSCPEAARQALLHADAFDFVEDSITMRQADVIEGFAGFGLTTAAVNDVRIFCLQLMRTTDLALWQRLAILGVFCERLNATLANGQHAAVPALLDDFAALIEQGSIVGALHDLRPNHEAQAMVFSTLLADRGFSSTSRMQAEQVHMIGANLGADASGQTTADALVASYTRGLERLGRALEQAPHLLENYVLNEMFLTLFPCYGINPFDAYLQLVARFGLLRLILAARCNNDGELPDANALVNTVHVYCRRFQHQSTFARRVNGALHASGWSSLDKLYGFLRS